MGLRADASFSRFEARPGSAASVPLASPPRHVCGIGCLAAISAWEVAQRHGSGTDARSRSRTDAAPDLRLETTIRQGEAYAWVFTPGILHGRLPAICRVAPVRWIPSCTS